MNRLFRAAAAVLLLFSASCYGTLEQNPGNLQVTLALGDSTLEVVDSRDVGELQNPAVDHDAVRFVFWPADGGDVVEGQIADTRVLRTEFDEDGNPAPQYVISSTGLFEVRIPSVRGDLELRGPDGELLGEVSVDPDAPITRRLALMRQADVVAGPVKVVDHGAKSDKIDILFLPEGYLSGDLSNFHRHVDSLVEQLQDKPIYGRYWNGFNFWRQDIRSRSRGVGAGGQAIDTAFETAAGVGGSARCVFFTNNAGMQAAKRIGDAAGADLVIVLANRTTTGACAGGGLIVSSRPAHVAESVAHEIGHALFGLADEYSTPRGDGRCTFGPNVSTSARNVPWSSMLTTNQLPTPTSASRGTIGAFQGGGYCATGRYRPTHDCLMRTLGREFCPVCRSVVASKMSRHANASGSASSASSSSVSAPRGLEPDGANVASTDVRLTWGQVAGASKYKVVVQRQVNQSWTAFGSVEASGTSARVTLRDAGGAYRWTVQACNSSACSAAATAQFTFNRATSGSTSSSTTSGVPAPTGLIPATSSVVSDSTPSLSWTGVPGASSYNFKMKWHDGSNWVDYISAQPVNSTRVSTTLRTPEHWYAFAVQACNGSECSAWTEFSTMYLRL